MKKALVLFFATIFVLHCAAQNDSEIRRQYVIEAVSYPSHLNAINEVEVVMVSYEIQADGNLYVTSSNASNMAFESYVIDTISALEFHGMEGKEQQSVKFSFVRR